MKKKKNHICLGRRDSREGTQTTARRARSDGNDFRSNRVRVRVRARGGTAPTRRGPSTSPHVGRMSAGEIRSCPPPSGTRRATTRRGPYGRPGLGSSCSAASNRSINPHQKHKHSQQQKTRRRRAPRTAGRPAAKKETFRRRMCGGTVCGYHYHLCQSVVTSTNLTGESRGFVV